MVWRISFRDRITVLIVPVAIAAGLVAASSGTAAAGYFSAMAGAWTGNGRLTLADGKGERIRCRAANKVLRGGDRLRQNLSCTSVSYKLVFTSELTYKPAAGVVTGSWREQSQRVGGFISGPARPGRIRAFVSSESFSARVVVVTRGNRQSVTITPKGLGVREISVKLTR